MYGIEENFSDTKFKNFHPPKKYKNHQVLIFFNFFIYFFLNFDMSL